MARTKIKVPLPYEWQDQVTVIQYCTLNNILCNHTPNEGKRSFAEGRKLKQMGLSKGFPDISILEPRGGFHGLYIEMKRKGNKASEEQIKWLMELKSRGYATTLCYSADDAIEKIKRYMNLKKGDVAE
jgi:hypothetical protein